MDTLHILLLALLQGLTEFLPISSSAHLILLPRLLGWGDQGLAFDVAVHVGTLLAVMFYFRDELQRLSVAWSASCLNRRMDADARLAWLLLLATIPVAVSRPVPARLGRDLPAITAGHCPDDDWVRGIAGLGRPVRQAIPQ